MPFGLWQSLRVIENEAELARPAIILGLEHCAEQ
jgi:hypothetical protein